MEQCSRSISAKAFSHPFNNRCVKYCDRTLYFLVSWMGTMHGNADGNKNDSRLPLSKIMRKEETSWQWTSLALAPILPVMRDCVFDKCVPIDQIINRNVYLPDSRNLTFLKSIFLFGVENAKSEVVFKDRKCLQERQKPHWNEDFNYCNAST